LKVAESLSLMPSKVGLRVSTSQQKEQLVADRAFAGTLTE
jgi:hypothetical protein